MGAGVFKSHFSIRFFTFKLSKIFHGISIDKMKININKKISMSKEKVHF